MKECPHTAFEAHVEVHRFDEANRPLEFLTTVKVHCRGCGRPFRFRGVDRGLDITGKKPMASADLAELRIMVEPDPDWRPS